jgi:hypothetical protein
MRARAIAIRWRSPPESADPVEAVGTIAKPNLLQHRRRPRLGPSSVHSFQPQWQSNVLNRCPESEEG